jgi:hypothetical protein
MKIGCLAFLFFSLSFLQPLYLQGRTRLFRATRAEESECKKVQSTVNNQTKLMI